MSSDPSLVQAATSGALIEAVGQLIMPLESLLTSVSRQVMKLYKRTKGRSTERRERG
jgi:hypothetical protein